MWSKYVAFKLLKYDLKARRVERNLREVPVPIASSPAALPSEKFGVVGVFALLKC